MVASAETSADSTIRTRGALFTELLCFGAKGCSNIRPESTRPHPPDLDAHRVQPRALEPAAAINDPVISAELT